MEMDPSSAVREGEMPISEESMGSMDITGEEAIPAEQNMGLESMSDMPMMGEEDKNLFMSLMKKGIPEDMIIDIMADSKVPVMGGAVGGAANAGMINPSEFGGLPKTGSSPAGNPSMQTSPATGNPTGMNQGDMAMYLQNKVNEIRGRTGGETTQSALGALPMARPNTLNDPSLNERTSNPNMNQPMNT